MIATSPDGKWKYDEEAGEFVPNKTVTWESSYIPVSNEFAAEAEAARAETRANADAFRDGVLREFDTGATRDTDDDKLDYEGFLSPQVLRRYADYMHANRVQSDGSLRDGDNWQKGIPLDVYMKSLWRHFMDVWAYHRMRDPNLGGKAESPLMEEALCAVLFNAMGYLHELLRDEA